MSLSALSLALGALSSALPVAALGTGLRWLRIFHPRKNCTAFAVDAIDRADTQIFVNAYGLTPTSSTVAAIDWLPRNDANRVDNDKERNKIAEELVRHAATGAIFY